MLEHKVPKLSRKLFNPLAIRWQACVEKDNIKLVEVKKNNYGACYGKPDIDAYIFNRKVVIRTKPTETKALIKLRENTILTLMKSLNYIVDSMIYDQEGNLYLDLKEQYDDILRKVVESVNTIHKNIQFIEIWHSTEVKLYNCNFQLMMSRGLM